MLYTGFTGNLQRRVFEHKEKIIPGFTSKYNIDKLVYYEICESNEGAITREKQIKNYSRRKKIQLIRSMNSEWKDLADDL
ncbi:MAG: GIY-YIG nuclease family protein [Dehalococcoidales bacterium]|nr:GIY-YIG nuclease family protein [Dehalococcoidales bacterium]